MMKAKLTMPVNSAVPSHITSDIPSSSGRASRFQISTAKLSSNTTIEIVQALIRYQPGSLWSRNLKLSSGYSGRPIKSQTAEPSHQIPPRSFASAMAM